MEYLFQNSKVHIGALIWILILSVGNTAYLSNQQYYESGDNLEVPHYRFESRKMNSIKRQADYLQHLDVESTEDPRVYTDEPANYDFEYKIHGGGNFLGHSETRRDVQTKGSYHALLPDGRMQIVSYYADETGYHPSIKYEIINPNPERNNNGKDPGLDDKSREQGYRNNIGGTGSNRLRKRYTRTKIVRRQRRFP